MKVGITQDHVAIVVNDVEHTKLLAKATSDDGRLRCKATLDPTESKLRVTFGSGRAFSKAAGAPNWRVQLSRELCRAQRVAEFGLTPVHYGEPGAGKIEIFMPDARNEIRRMPTKNQGVAARAQQLLKRFDDPPLPTVSDEELALCKKVFNRAVECGYAPQCDARGRILWFERKTAED